MKVQIIGHLFWDNQ